MGGRIKVNSQKEKDILSILRTIEQLDKNIYRIEDFNVSQESLEKAMSYILSEGLLVNYNSEWSDDKLQMFSTFGISSTGYKFIKDSNLITKAYNVTKSISDLIP